MISTLKNNAVFLKALNKGGLLSTQEQTIYDSIYFRNHSSCLPGYQSVAQYRANIDATVIQFINSAGNNSKVIASRTFDSIIELL